MTTSVANAIITHRMHIITPVSKSACKEYTSLWQTACHRLVYGPLTYGGVKIVDPLHWTDCIRLAHGFLTYERSERQSYIPGLAQCSAGFVLNIGLIVQNWPMALLLMEGNN